MHIGDIAAMTSMTRIGYDDLFAPAPSPQTLPLLAAWLGSTAWPTWRAGFADQSGTVLGPDGATVPHLSGLGASAVAANMDQANDTGLPLGPVSFVTAMPSIIPPAKSATVAAPPDVFCKLGNWVAANPGTAVVAVVAVFLALRGGKR